MWPYWMAFLLPAAAALWTSQLQPRLAAHEHLTKWNAYWAVAAAAITLMVGYRVEVGGDWPAYLIQLADLDGRPFLEIFELSDPSYRLLNWVSIELGWGIFGVNLISAGIFATGLIRFCHALPRPWLGLVVAIPYMVIVVAMGYTRQSVALGLAMLGLLALERRSNLGFVFWVLLGATFHKSAVLLLPIVALANTRDRFWISTWVGVVGVGAYFLLVEDSVEHLYVNYIEAEYQSEGALVRMLMNALPAIVLLTWWERFPLRVSQKRLWGWIAIISLGLLAVLFLSPATTAVDRIGLYFIPLQLVVLSHLPTIFGDKRGLVIPISVLVVAYCATVQFVWLNYATFAEYWLPYRFYPVDGLPT